MGDESMHTIETAVAIPLILLILLGGIGLSLATLQLIGNQMERYQTESVDPTSECVQVLRITEVVYEIMEDMQK